LLLQRYCGAAYRYLRGAVGDDDTALELLQEFVLRFLRGDFRRADPGLGRFRDYLKASLIHLVADHYREKRTYPRSLPDNMELWAIAPDNKVDNESAFLESWRDELINRTWIALGEANSIYHAVLALHVENPTLHSAIAAEELKVRLSKQFTAAHVRVTLQRAREKFATLLLDEVAHSIGSCTEAELIKELKALRMLKLCSPALQKRNRCLTD